MFWIRFVVCIGLLGLAACVSITSDPEDLKQRSTLDLCESYASYAPQPPFGHFDMAERQEIKAELERRAAITDTEWSLIDRHEAKVGMHECALIASWGHPQEIQHTETEKTSTAHYTFGKCPWDFCRSTQHAYVAQGQIVSLQY